MLRALRRLLRAVDRVTAAMAYVGGALFLLVSFYMTADVIGRRIQISSAVTDEMGGSSGSTSSFPTCHACSDPFSTTSP